MQEDYPNFSGNLDRLNLSYERPAKLHCASVDTPSRGAADDRLGRAARHLGKLQLHQPRPWAFTDGLIPTDCWLLLESAFHSS